MTENLNSMNNAAITKKGFQLRIESSLSEAFRSQKRNPQKDFFDYCPENRENHHHWQHIRLVF